MSTTVCQLCGTREATYVCQSCGRTVCNHCFNPARWTCVDCLARNRGSLAREHVISRVPVAALLFFTAFAMIVIGMLLIAAGSTTGTSSGVSWGAVILIGPIPIILGTGPYSFEMILVAALLTALGLGFFLLVRRKARL
jgi:uncharacterized membrane protein